MYPFEKPNLSCKQTGKELISGRRPQFPEHIEKSNDPSIMAVKKALSMCWTQDWKQRPSARSISEYLYSQLQQITGEKDPDVRVVLPERDSKQTNTDSDWSTYNQDWEDDYDY